jgi:molecular chaperone DnaK
MAKDNRSLGMFNLDGIAPAPRGMPQIEVSFDIDANGIVNVTAKDKATGREQHITITEGSGLSKEDIDGAIRDAERYADEDSRRREAVDLRNESDHVGHQIRRILDENRASLDDETIRVVEQKLEEVERLKDGGEVGQLKAALEELKTVSQRMGEVLYKQQTSQPGAQPQPDFGARPTPSGDDVIDAEFTEGG